MHDINEVREICLNVLRSAGVPASNAEIQVDLLLDAQLKGHASHGLLRLPRLVNRIHNGVADPVAEGCANWRKSAFLEVDGQNGLGPVVALNALQLACDHVAETGVVTVALRDCNHLGMLAWYAERIATAGKVLIGFTLSEALVHPWGGRKAMVGTNPLAIGVPAEPRPFVMDMATSEVSMGKIHDYANRNQDIPHGWALDADGEPTTNARAATKGAVTPFGGAKGYALGLGFEVLVSSLTASVIGTEIKGTLDDDQVCNKGDVFIVMEPAEGIGSTISAYLDAVRSTPPIHPGHPVMVPGDRAASRKQESLASGITIDPGVWAEIKALPRRNAQESELI